MTATIHPNFFGIDREKSWLCLHDGNCTLNVGITETTTGKLIKLLTEHETTLRAEREKLTLLMAQDAS
jgi:hypothetical protein